MSQEPILNGGLYAIAIGMGGIKTSLPTHGADQLDHNKCLLLQHATGKLQQWRWWIMGEQQNNPMINSIDEAEVEETKNLPWIAFSLLHHNHDELFPSTASDIHSSRRNHNEQKAPQQLHNPNSVPHNTSPHHHDRFHSDLRKPQILLQTQKLHSK
ncbi:hypothetical protein K1719_032786 [Acacia pycnantha]|nr:hypothetical protein K1719_032786 [Acacia pycnantha]